MSFSEVKTGSKKISVVIPLYNKALHIESTLASVLSQTVQPLEVIVVDDGSTDGGAEIVEKMKHPLLKLIKQENKGVSAARNAGVREAAANYVAFLDADDSWQVFHLEEMSGLIDKYSCGLYSTLFNVSHGSNVYTPRAPYPLGFVGLVDNFFVRHADGLSFVSSSTTCVHRKALLDIGGFPENIKKGEDIIVWIKLAQGFGMAHSSKVTATWNKNAVNRSSKVFEKEPPGSLLYLSGILQGETSDKLQKKGVLRLFSSIAFFTALGMRESGDMAGLKSILALSFRLKLWGLTTVVAMIFLAPMGLLSFARRLRDGRRARHPKMIESTKT